MYKNLKMVMAFKGVTNEAIAKLLGVCRDTVANKINGETEFSYEQAILIHDTFFSEYSIRYLFQKIETE